MNNETTAVGKLYGLRAYLAGPIQFCDDRGLIWRDIITPKLQELGVVVLDPTKLAPINSTQIDLHTTSEELRASKSWHKLTDIWREVRRFDLKLVDQSDFLIVNYDPDIKTCGTWEELFWANRLKRPILIFCKGGKSNIPWWLFGTLPHYYFFETLDEIINSLTELDNGSKSMDDRWIIIPTLGALNAKVVA